MLKLLIICPGNQTSETWWLAGCACGVVTQALKHETSHSESATAGLHSGGKRMKLQGSETKAIVGMLQKAPLWAGLTEKELKVIARSFKELKYESGDFIVHKGERGIGFYLIVDGTVEVRTDGRVLSRLGPGQFFGEMALLDGQPRSADVVALEPSKCLALSSWNFNSIVSDYPKMALKLLQESTRRSRTNTQNLSE
jgi:CRP-like cAMP-binding protein